MTDVTDIKHYTNYPVCGFCTNAWDIVYGRQRSTISCEKWLTFCKWGGCDPDIWDHIDDRTGWPWGMKIDKATGWPKCFIDLTLEIAIPAYDNRVYHMRSDDGDKAPWRKTSDRLRAAVGQKKARIKGINLDDPNVWEDADTITDEDLFGPFGDEAMDAKLDGAVDLDDPDLW